MPHKNLTPEQLVALADKVTKDFEGDLGDLGDLGELERAVGVLRIPL